jgi:sugar O-acyltransferase (sialic acid O-acetyltransferase NeuD family)
MKERQLIMVGGGGHCRSLIEVAESAGYAVLGVLDLPENVGKEFLSTQVIGTDDDIPAYVDQAEFVIAVGSIKDPSTRIRLFEQVKAAGGKLATVVASTARVSKYAMLGEGTVVMHHALVNAGAKVGSNVILNSFADIEHDSVIGDHCHVSTGAIVNGGCRVGSACFVGSGAVLVQGINIGEGIVIGAGSLVVGDISTKGVYAGNPAILFAK